MDASGTSKRHIRYKHFFLSLKGANRCIEGILVFNSHSVNTSVNELWMHTSAWCDIENKRSCSRDMKSILPGSSDSPFWMLISVQRTSSSYFNYNDVQQNEYRWSHVSAINWAIKKMLIYSSDIELKNQQLTTVPVLRSPSTMNLTSHASTNIRTYHIQWSVNYKYGC